MDVRLTTLGRRVQPEQDLAIATSVLSGDDLRRGGARTVLDALDWMPGVSVSAFNGRTTSVATRGDGSSLIAHNTLIMRDGRAQESAGGGPPWAFLNMPIEHVQRIEIQRGAGNTLWGSSAANCVINIVTRSAGDSNTGAVDADSNGRRAAAAQWGMRSASGWSTSFWIAGNHQPGTDTFAGRDDWDNVDGRSLDATARLAVEGGSEAAFNINTYDDAGGSSAIVGRANVRREQRTAQREASTRLTVPQADSGQIELAGYVQDIKVRTEGGGQSARRNNDLSGRRFWRLGAHDAMAGGSVHTTVVRRTAGATGLTTETQEQDLQVYAQDEWHFGGDRGALIVGAQAQREFTDTQVDNIYATTLRLRWAATPDLSLWAGLSRSGTSPNGGQKLDIPSFETGLRWHASPGLQVNGVVFEQRFSSLSVPVATGGPGQPPPGPGSPPPLDTRLRVHGIEGDLHWQAMPRVKLDASFTALRARFDIADNRTATLATEAGYFGATPRNSFKARALYEIDERQSVEVGLRARSDLNFGASPGRGVLDLVWRHRLPQSVELGVALKQLNHDSLPDFRPNNSPFAYREVRTLALWLSWGV
ncbi:MULTISPECIES: TonB-dependent siderophore receptor [unclassified Rhizobacter]|nr:MULTISPECIES: TonB-dependent receptor plug domain-containing protein [unclassified Rhizobacter]